jgi:hypothetical protein
VNYVIPLKIGTSLFLYITAEKGSSKYNLVITYNIVFNIEVLIKLEDLGFESSAVAIVVIRPS